MLYNWIYLKSMRCSCFGVAKDLCKIQCIFWSYSLATASYSEPNQSTTMLDAEEIIAREVIQSSASNLVNPFAYYKAREKLGMAPIVPNKNRFSRSVRGYNRDFKTARVKSVFKNRGFCRQFQSPMVKMFVWKSFWQPQRRRLLKLIPHCSRVHYKSTATFCWDPFKINLINLSKVGISCK